MTGPIEPAGPSLVQDPHAASDRLFIGGQSITACRSLAAPLAVNRAARTVEVVWSTGAWARAEPRNNTQERSVLVAVNVDSDGRRKILGMVIGASKLETVCLGFSRWPTGRGLRSAELVIPPVNAEAVHSHLDGEAKMAKTNHRSG